MYVNCVTSQTFCILFGQKFPGISPYRTVLLQRTSVRAYRSTAQGQPRAQPPPQRPFRTRSAPRVPHRGWTSYVASWGPGRWPLLCLKPLAG